jgi:hypothetical protein
MSLNQKKNHVDSFVLAATSTWIANILDIHALGSANRMRRMSFCIRVCVPVLAPIADGRSHRSIGPVTKIMQSGARSNMKVPKRLREVVAYQQIVFFVTIPAPQRNHPRNSEAQLWSR